MKHLYLIGIGGVGMLWIADWALSKGYIVSGSDINDSPRLDDLRSRGANIHIGTDTSLIPSDVSEVIINSAITETSPSYPELLEVKKRGLGVMKRSEFVGYITRQYKTILVSGTHGKTTTTGMIGWILEAAGLDPTVFVGGAIHAWEDKTRIGKGEWLVVEADEFDRSFHRFSGEIAVILNIEADHLDYYTEGLPEIEQSFHRFLRNLPHKQGMVVAYGKNKSIRKAVKGFKYKNRFYDENNIWPGLKLMMPGMHNLLNATAAAKVAHEIGIESKVIQDALAKFPGVGRRFEFLGKVGCAQVYDDYGHHPTEVAATLQALNERFGKMKTAVIFQPHQKARTKHLLSEFIKCFSNNHPTKLVIAPIYQVAGREETIDVSNHSIADAISYLSVQAPDSNEEVVEIFKRLCDEMDVVLIMGAGSIRSIIEPEIKQK